MFTPIRGLAIYFGPEDNPALARLPDGGVPEAATRETLARLGASGLLSAPDSPGPIVLAADILGPLAADQHALSPTQVQVLELFSHGYTEEKVAIEMDVEETTIQTHTDVARTRLGVTKTTTAILGAILLGDISVEPIDGPPLSKIPSNSDVLVAIMASLGYENKQIDEIFTQGKGWAKHSLLRVREAIGAKNRQHIPRRLIETGLVVAAIALRRPTTGH